MKRTCPTSSLDLSVLKEKIALVLDALMEQEGKADIEIVDSLDFYWSVPIDRAFDVDSDPGPFGIRKVSEDWELVEGVTADEGDISSLTLDYFAGVLRYIARVSQL